MEQLLDDDLKQIRTINDALDFYSPLLLSGKIERSTIRKRLLTEHSFSDQDTKVIMGILSDRQLRYISEVPESNVYLIYFKLISGIVLFIGGVVLTIVLWKIGFLAGFSFAICAAGVGIALSAHRQLNLIQR